MVFVPVFVLIVMMPAVAQASNVAGPVEASLVRVIDGDTIEADAHVWPGHTVRVSVRLRGIDAPEQRAKCEAEKAASDAARIAVERLLATGRLRVRNIMRDKYFGRVVADVETEGGVAVAPILLRQGLVRAYDGKSRAAWCD